MEIPAEDAEEGSAAQEPVCVPYLESALFSTQYQIFTPLTLRSPIIIVAIVIPVRQIHSDLCICWAT